MQFAETRERRLILARTVQEPAKKRVVVGFAKLVKIVFGNMLVSPLGDELAQSAICPEKTYRNLFPTVQVEDGNSGFSFY